MTARTVMDPNPTLIRSTDTMGVVAGKIMQRRYRSLPVVDDEHRFLGVVTVNTMLLMILPQAATIKRGVENISYANASSADLRDRFMRHVNDPVSDYLKEEVVTVDPETPLLQTLLTLYHERSNLPVVDRKTGRLEGMISYYDVGENIMQDEDQKGRAE